MFDICKYQGQYALTVSTCLKYDLCKYKKTQMVDTWDWEIVYKQLDDGITFHETDVCDMLWSWLSIIFMWN